MCLVCTFYTSYDVNIGLYKAKIWSIFDENLTKLNPLLEGGPPPPLSTDFFLNPLLRGVPPPPSSSGHIFWTLP